MDKPKTTQITDDYIMGIDFGQKNIGLALGKSGLCSPLRIVSAKNLTEAIHEIARQALENKVRTLVIGLPLTVDGKETKKSLEVRHFGKLLKINLKLPITYQNEYGTTIDASEEMIDLEIAQKQRRVKDHYAATLILKRYYDSLKG